MTKFNLPNIKQMKCLTNKILKIQDFFKLYSHKAALTLKNKKNINSHSIFIIRICLLIQIITPR